MQTRARTHDGTAERNLRQALEKRQEALRALRLRRESVAAETASEVRRLCELLLAHRGRAQAARDALAAALAERKDVTARIKAAQRSVDEQSKREKEREEALLVLRTKRRRLGEDSHRRAPAAREAPGVGVGALLGLMAVLMVLALILGH